MKPVNSGNNGGGNQNARPAPPEMVSWTGCSLKYYRPQGQPEIRTGADPLKPQQWHLKNLGSIEGKRYTRIKAGQDLNVRTPGIAVSMAMASAWPWSMTAWT